MFGKNLTKKTRIALLEQDADDTHYELMCEMNPMNVRKRLNRLELFKGETNDSIELLYELQEGLGQKVKNIQEDVLRNKVDTSMIIISLLKHLDLKLDKEYNLVKNAKPLSTPTKTTKRKSK